MMQSDFGKLCEASVDSDFTSHLIADSKMLKFRFDFFLQMFLRFNLNVNQNQVAISWEEKNTKNFGLSFLEV